MNLALGFGLQKVALGALLNPFGADYFQEGTIFDNGKVCLQLDDGYADNYTAGLPIFLEKDIPCTFFVTGQNIGQANMMTWAQVKLLQDQGMDIQCHTMTYGDMRGGTDQQLITDLSNLNSAFVSADILTPKHIAYPGGFRNDRVISAIDELRLTGRTTDDSQYQINRKSQKYTLPGINIVSSKVTIKAAMDAVKLNKTAMCLFGHRVGGASTGGLFITEADLRELIDYGKSIGIDFIKTTELYEQMLYIDVRLSRPATATTIDITLKNRLDATKDSISLERSTDGITFTEIAVLDPGVDSYSDTGLTLSTVYYYRARGFRGTTYLPYSGTYDLSTDLSFTLTSTGTGAGVATLQMYSVMDIELSIDGNGKFYTNSGGTENESTTALIESRTTKTVYIKVTSGTCNLTFKKNKLVRIDLWTSGTNAPSISGDVSKFTDIEMLNIQGNNTVSGDITKLLKLNYIWILGNNTISGSITNLTKLTYINVTGSNTITGSVTNLTLLTRLVVFSAGSSISGSITNCTLIARLQVTGTNTLTGSIDALTNLDFLYCTGNNTISGDLAIRSAKLTYVYLTPCAMDNYTSGANWSKIDANQYIWVYPAVGYGYSISDNSQFIIEVATTKVAGRAIQLRLLGTCASMADTNQGGIWGDYSGTAAPSALATAYKAINVDSGACLLIGITKPAATGDGTGFPVGFGNWFRS